MDLYCASCCPAPAAGPHLECFSDLALQHRFCSARVGASAEYDGSGQTVMVGTPMSTRNISPNWLKLLRAGEITVENAEEILKEIAEELEAGESFAVLANVDVPELDESPDLLTDDLAINENPSAKG